jgi:curli biogenesis system outer membrane secretion channel CsgG
MRKVSGMIFIALCMLAVGAYAQNITGSVAGSVVDQQEASVPNATVTVTEPAKKITVNTKTSSEGRKR